MFIALEGIDGSGKSTLARALAERLAARLGRERVILTREPTDDSEWGRRLRRSEGAGRLAREDEIEHFHRDRVHHLANVVRPALAAGKIVICDRYVDSMLAYQARDPADADRLLAQRAGEIIVPDLVLILELPVETALTRIGGAREARTSFEREETLRRAASIYASRCGARYSRLDATKPAAELLEEAFALIGARLKSTGVPTA
jgi:dTMP kinase